MVLDYSLYLVTDSSKALLGDRSLAEVVSKAVDGGESFSLGCRKPSLTNIGVTIVQYRDKKSNTGELIRVATQLLGVTKLTGVPLIINDRVDVALAVGADGVHLGQDDMGEYLSMTYHTRYISMVSIATKNSSEFGFWTFKAKGQRLIIISLSFSSRASFVESPI